MQEAENSKMHQLNFYVGNQEEKFSELSHRFEGSFLLHGRGHRRCRP